MGLPDLPPPASGLPALLVCLQPEPARAAEPLRQALRQGWPLVRTALLHGLSPLLYMRLQENDLLGLLPADDRAALRAAHLDCLRRATTSAEVLRKVLRLLDPQGIPVLPLKGTALAALLWPDPLPRPMADLDLLLLPEQIEQARETLVAAGFHSPAIPWCPNRWEYHLPRLEVSATAAELHWRLWPPSPLQPFALPEAATLLNRAVTGTLNGAEVRVPSAADQLLIAAASLAEDGFAVRLRHWADLLWILQRFGEGDEQGLWEWAGQQGMRGYLGFTLRFLGALVGPLPISIPQDEAAAAAYRELAPVLRQRLQDEEPVRSSVWMLRALYGRRVPDDDWRGQLPPGLRGALRAGAARNAVIHCGGAAVAVGRLVGRLGGLIVRPAQRRALRQEGKIVRVLGALARETRS